MSGISQIQNRLKSNHYLYSFCVSLEHAFNSYLFCLSSVLNDLNNRYHQCLEKASQLKQLIEPGLQNLDGKAMTVSLFKLTGCRQSENWNSAVSVHWAVHVMGFARLHAPRITASSFFSRQK